MENLLEGFLISFLNLRGIPSSITCFKHSESGKDIAQLIKDLEDKQYEAAGKDLVKVLDALISDTFNCAPWTFLIASYNKYQVIKALWENPELLQSLVLSNTLNTKQWIIQDMKTFVHAIKIQKWFYVGFFLGSIADEFLFGVPGSAESILH